MDSTERADRPNAGSIWLILIPSVTSPEHAPGVYLDLPLDEVPRLTTHPLKFLRYLGTVILGQEGTISGTENEPSGDDDCLIDRAVYVFTTRTGEFYPELLVNLDPFIMYGDKSSEYESQTSSQCLNSRFREDLMRRDGNDIFKLVPSEEDDFLNSEGIHIIPHAREGESLLKTIVENRTLEATHDDLHDINDLDDIRNGFLGSASLNKAMRRGDCGVMTTPNRILGVDDIPHRVERSLGPNLSYPLGVRFTQHSFTRSADNISNIDASFRSSHEMRLPSSTLLQYHYGVCALKRWGRNVDGVDFSNLRQGKALGQGPSVTISSQSRGHTDRAKKIERGRTNWNVKFQWVMGSALPVKMRPNCT